MKERIALTVICGGSGDQQEGLRRLVAQVSPYVDGIFVAYNGRGKPHFDDPKVVVDTFEWQDDFGLARQQSFDMVPKGEFDWLLWLDTDDTLMEPERLQDVISGCPEGADAIFLRYVYLYDHTTGVPQIEQWRERMMRADRDWRWRYTVHETCHGRPGTKHHAAQEVWVRHEREETSEADPRKRERNRRILVRSIAKWPNEPRYVYYLAHELMAEATSAPDTPERDELIDSAIKQYEKFLGMAPWNDDAYVANCRIADMLRMRGEYNRAIDIDMQGVKLYPTWPTAYIGIMRSLMAVGDWQKLLFWADVAIEHATKRPQTTQVFQPHEATWAPWLMRGIAKESLGDFAGATIDYRRAGSFPGAPQDEVQRRLEGIATRDDQEPRPRPEVRQKTAQGRLRDKTVAFLTRPSFEPWHPTLAAKEGVGGSEMAVMRIAERFAYDGYQTFVFGTPGDLAGEHEGVEYHPHDAWDHRDPFDIVISSRAPEVFDAPMRAPHKALWMHDINVGPDAFVSDWGPRDIDYVFAVSNWHKRHLMKLYGLPGDLVNVMPNGIDHLWPDTPRNGVPFGPRFVYSSSPDRGLDTLLHMWPRILQRWPGAQLHVFYGWTAIDKIIARGYPSSPALAHFKAGVEMQLEELGREEGGIVWHDRVNNEELRAALATMDVWLYPAYFMETFCITAIEMQAAGVLCVTSDKGALPEALSYHDFMVSGWPNNVTFQDQFLAAVTHAVNVDMERLGHYQRMGRERSRRFIWDHVYAMGWRPWARGLS